MLSVEAGVELFKPAASSHTHMPIKKPNCQMAP